jgi:hypothetical protein
VIAFAASNPSAVLMTATTMPTFRLFRRAAIRDGLFAISTYHLVVNPWNGKAI